MILSLVAFGLRITLLAVFTFAFVVLYEHGPAEFLNGAATEWQALTKSLTGAPKEPNSHESGT
ncbi:MAG: hypothetical protein SFU53_05955 [Terrimicrobiaceae bacterium]|nr:hypothetical protein [Terrimicrobiaceae bacterium]